jgi:catechol 2,3-dioxygenase-like lactoylglutathione lyase family enzyme
MEASPTNYPAVAVGHVAKTVADLEASYQFYVRLGLRSFGRGDGMAILELRGGTHLLLFQRGGGAGPADVDAASFDLMIAGRTLAELEAFRDSLVAAGLPATPIPEERFYGHYRFETQDPDGARITVSTSHASNLPV